MTRGLLILALALLPACTPRPEPITAVQCPAWKNVDLRALPTHLNDEPNEPLLEDLLTGWIRHPDGTNWKPASPTAAIRFQTAPGMGSDRDIREITAKRSTEGWEVYARAQDISGPWTAWRPVRLSPQAGRRLDATLEDPCLWVSPRFLGDQVRLLNGRYDWRPDGPSTRYDITREGHRWSGWHFSWSVGPPGELRRVLLAEAFGLPEYALDEIDSQGWLDRPS